MIVAGGLGAKSSPLGQRLDYIQQTSPSRLQSRLSIHSWQVPVGLGKKAELEGQVHI